MTYEELLPVLKSNHITRIKQVVKNEKVMELHIDCSPLIKDAAIKICEDVCGKEYKVSWMPNNDYILIKKMK